jgi:hypothetical protein
MDKRHNIKNSRNQINIPEVDGIWIIEMATQTEGADENRPLDRPTGGGDSKASADVANTGNIEKGMSVQGVPCTPQLRSPTNYGPVRASQIHPVWNPKSQYSIDIWSTYRAAL